MDKKNKFNIFAGVAVLGIALVFCIGYFRETITVESGIFNLNLSPGKGISRSKLVSYDIQNEMKALNEKTSTIPIAIGQGSLVTNSGQKPAWISIKVNGIPGRYKIQNSNPGIDTNSGRFLKPLLPGENLEICIKVDLDKESIKKYLIAEGSIEFYDYIDNSMLGVIPVRIINSKPNGCCASE